MMNNDYNLIVRKNSYFLTIIDKNKFIELGAQSIINDNLYFIKKKYDGTITGETCAVLGISINYIIDIYETIKIIKNSKELNYIEDINKITFSCSNIFVIEYFKDIIMNQSLDKLLIFNIEPKGQNVTQLKFYPNPIITIPGGNMEINDKNSFENCALREFMEETGINIKNKYKIIGIHRHPILKIMNNNFNSRTMPYPSHSRFYYIYNKYKKYNNTFIRVEKYYYLAKTLF